MFHLFQLLFINIFNELDGTGAGTGGTGESAIIVFRYAQEPGSVRPVAEPNQLDETQGAIKINRL